MDQSNPRENSAVPEGDDKALMEELLAAACNPIGTTNLFDSASAAPPPRASEEPSAACAPVPAPHPLLRVACTAGAIALAIVAIVSLAS